MSVPDDYIIDHDCDGNTISRGEQVKKAGNMVCPPIAAALVKANLPEMCVARRQKNMQIRQESGGQMRFA